MLSCCHQLVRFVFCLLSPPCYVLPTNQPFLTHTLQRVLLLGYHASRQLLPQIGDLQHSRLRDRKRWWGGHTVVHVRPLPLGLREAHRVPQPTASAGKIRVVQTGAVPPPVKSTQALEEYLSSVETVLRIDRDAWSSVKLLRQARRSTVNPSPHLFYTEIVGFEASSRP